MNNSTSTSILLSTKDSSYSRPFVIKDDSTNNNNEKQSLFLGLLNRRYIRTFHGIIHGLGSMVALVLGNYVFLERVLIGNNVDFSSTDSYSFLRTASTIYHLCNFTASVITALFFWNKVQAWQLSTTTLEEKGLTPKIVQQFNQGRGVVCMILFSLFPLVLQYSPRSVLEDRTFSTIFAFLLISGSFLVYNLIKGYGKILFVVYGFTPIALGISILMYCVGQQGGTIASFNENYPLVLNRIEKEASFVISCVQMGFMLYYMYSRNLVTQITVQKICKCYHVTMLIIYLFRVERDLWLYFTTTTTTTIYTTANTDCDLGSIPALLLVQPVILTIAILAIPVRLIVKKLIMIIKKSERTRTIGDCHKRLGSKRRRSIILVK